MKRNIILLFLFIGLLTLIGCNSNPNNNPSVNKETVNVEERELFSSNNISITVKSLENSIFGPVLKLFIVNNNTKNIIVQINDASVNNYMVDTTFSCNVNSLKSINSGITFMQTSLDESGINTIKNMEFKFHILDAQTFTKIIDSDTIYIETNASAPQDKIISGNTVFDNGNFKLVVLGIDETENIYGPKVKLYIENNSNQDVTFQTREVSINGIMVQPTFSCNIVSGKKAFDNLQFFRNVLNDNGIETFNNIEFKITIFETSTYNSIFTTETINVNFN